MLHWLYQEIYVIIGELGTENRLGERGEYELELLLREQGSGSKKSSSTDKSVQSVGSISPRFKVICSGEISQPVLKKKKTKRIATSLLNYELTILLYRRR